MVKTLLVFNGTGSHGLWQWVAWRYLAAHVEPDAVLGQGIGGLNAWMVATNSETKEIGSGARWINPSFIIGEAHWPQLPGGLHIGWAWLLLFSQFTVAAHSETL